MRLFIRMAYDYDVASYDAAVLVVHTTERHPAECHVGYVIDSTGCPRSRPLFFSKKRESKPESQSVTKADSLKIRSILRSCVVVTVENTPTLEVEASSRSCSRPLHWYAVVVLVEYGVRYVLYVQY